MKTFSHKRIAIIVAVSGALITCTGMIASHFLMQEYPLTFSLFVALLVFLVLYIISFYALRSLIVHKIKPIYKTIFTKHASAPDSFATDLFDDIDLITQTEHEVTEWAQRKTREIEELRKLEKYRKEYIGNVSHELKTPIFSIQGYISTLLDGGLEDETINRKYLERADNAIYRMISIVQDLESISKLEAGELSVQCETFDMIHLVKEVYEAQELLAQTKHTKLLFKTSIDKPVFVYADRRLIYQVVTNLVTNSIKYGKEQGITRVGFYDMDTNILIEVVDNGIGIDERHLSRIFERFFRVDKSRSREQGGTGLGLSIVKHIIEAHNQTINVKSELQMGTSFTFTLLKAQKKQA